MRLPIPLPLAQALLLALTALLTACNNNTATTATTPNEAVTRSDTATHTQTQNREIPANATTITKTPSATPHLDSSTTTAAPANATTAVLADVIASGAPTSLDAYQQSLARRCASDADCVVKNVGSCCGYTPQCVHRDVATFPAEVKALCEKEGRSSICGFQEPAGCACVDNQCRASNGAGL